MKKMMVWLAAAALLLGSLSACSKAADENAVKEITLTESWDFSSGFYPVLTPEKSTNYGIFYYAVNFYETLVNYDNGKFVPGLADSWQISDDGKVYTFNLKKDVKFSDGAEFNAEVVKINLEHIPAMLGQYNGSYGTVSTLLDRIEVVDSHTVEVHLKNPYYGALKDFTMLNPMAMVSPNAFKEDGTLSEAMMTSTLGTGPYKYEGQTDGTMYTFVKNSEYRGKQPQVETFRVKIIADNDAKLLALRSGEIDMIVGNEKLSYDGFNELSAANGYAGVVSDAVSATRLIGFNVHKAPFDDLNVRLAVSYGLDKAGISANLLSGIEDKAGTLFDPSMPYSDVGLKPYEYDKDKALALLEQAGWIDQDGDGIREKGGVRLEGDILYSKGSAIVDDLALALTAAFKDLGMDIKVNGLEMMAFYSETMQNNFTITLGKTYGLTYDPYTFITNMNASLQVDNVAAQGLSLIDNGDAIISELNATEDENKVQETYDLILNEIHDQAIFVPVSNIKELAVFNSSKIESYTFNGQPANVDVANIKLK
jgi:nickel transport system substrate-binding protein